MRFRWITLLLLLQAYLASGASPALRQSFDLRVPAAPVPVLVDGRQRLVYELHFTNFSATTLAVDRVDVVDGRQDCQTLASWQGDPLASRIAHPGAGQAKGIDSREFAPGTTAVLYSEVLLDRERILPKTLSHVVMFHEVPAATTNAPTSVRGGRTDIDPRAIRPALGAPLRGGPWLAIYGASFPRGHRRVTFAVDGQVRIPARFAIDWVKLDEQGRSARGDDKTIANWYGDGEDVLAMADGMVIASRDTIAESPILVGNGNAIENASGNFVTIGLRDGRYVTYEHLKPRSLRVREGERVRRGQVVAALGYTGDSTGPHLHVHVSDGAGPLAGEGLPYTIERFRVLGAYPSIEAFAAGGRWISARTRDVLHRDEMPAENMVIDFDTTSAISPANGTMD